MAGLEGVLSPVENLWMTMNKATVYILQCRYNEALDILTQVFQDEAVLTAWKKRDAHRTNSTDASSNRSKRVRLGVTPLPSACPTNSSGAFLNPFSIDQHGVLHHHESDRQQILLSMCAVSLFNMAVAYHTMALFNCQTGSPCKEPPSNSACPRLHKARSLYLQANILLQTVANLTPGSSLINLYLAICNNMAEVESQLGNKTDIWRAELAEKFCSIPSRDCCPVYQHFDQVVMTYHRRTPS